MVKECSGLTVECKLESIIGLLNESYDVLRKNKTEQTINITYLEAVAKVRFSIEETTIFLHSHHNGGLLDAQQLSELMQLLKKFCTDHLLNSMDFRSKSATVFGPGIYLLKLLVRQYGLPLLKQVSEKNPWIIPESLRAVNLVCYANLKQQC